MTEENFFNQGRACLCQIRDELRNCDELAAKVKQLKEKCDRLKKNVSQEEKSIQDEINSTVKKRKAELEKSYDDKLDAARKQLKKAQDKRNKEKSDKVEQRMNAETADVKKDRQELKTELKTLFRKNNVPGFCRTGLYYTLFMPKGIKEILALLLLIILGLGVIPCGVYLLLTYVVLVGNPIVSASYFMALVIAVMLILVLGIYFLIFNLTKVKYRDVLIEGRKLRNEIRARDKNIKAIKNAINKDKDESQYDLGAHDEKIGQVQEELDDIAQKKNDALKEFQKKTKDMIEEEIHGRRDEKLEQFRYELDGAEAEYEEFDKQFRETSLAIADQYGKYLGKNICKVHAIEDLIDIMDTEQVATISEALAIYKGDVPRKSASNQE